MLGHSTSDLYDRSRSALLSVEHRGLAGMLARLTDLAERERHVPFYGTGAPSQDVFASRCYASSVEGRGCPSTRRVSKPDTLSITRTVSNSISTVLGPYLTRYRPE